MLDIPFLIAAAGVGEKAAEVAETFGLKGSLIIAQALNFLIVLYVLHRFAFKPVLAAIDQRQAEIRAGLAYAEEMKIKLAEAERQQEETLRNASAQAQMMVDEARATAKELTERQVQEAATRAEEIIRKAQEASELDRKKIMAEAREQIARLVVQTSAKVLSRELSDEERSRYSRAAGQELTNA